MTHSFEIPFLAILSVSIALAQQAPAAPNDTPSQDQAGSAAAEESDLSLGSLRSQLDERGVSVGLSYTSELFSVLRGGIQAGRRSEYLGSLVPTLMLDFSRIGIGRGQFYLSAQSLHGRGINDSHVGAVQALSNLDDAHFGKFVEAWYASSYWNGLVRIKAGRQYADAEFGVVENGGNFLNSSYGLNPTTPMPTYPTPELGASVWLAPASWISWGFGAYKGGTLDPLTEEGAIIHRRPFMMLETRIEPFGKNSASHGSYSVGIWRQSRGAWLAGGDEQAAPVRNYGVYAVADHWFKRSPSGDHAGPGLFFQWGWTPSDRNEITGYTGGGVAWAGLLPSRRQDSAGMGVTRASLAGAAHGETIIEWFYKCQITAKLMLQPNLQWVVRPAGDGRNALVAGLRMGVEF